MKVFIARERIGDPSQVRIADDLASVAETATLINAPAKGAAKAAEVSHLAVLPEERVHRRNAPPKEAVLSTRAKQ